MRSAVRCWKRCSFPLLSSSAHALRSPARCVTSSSIWCLAAHAAVSLRKLPSGSAVLQSFSVCTSAAVLSDAAGREKVHCCAPKLRCAVIARASCASVSKHAMYLCGASESCGQTALISDACQCSANQAHLFAVTIQPPMPMRSPSARASAATGVGGSASGYLLRCAGLCIAVPCMGEGAGKCLWPT